MSRQIRPVELAFVESAAVRLVFAAGMAAPPAAVYRALADETEAWPEWFTALATAVLTPDGRHIRLRGGFLFWETVLAAEPGARYAYRADRTNVPGMRALAEEWRLEPTAGGTRVRWTFATDGTAAYRAFLRPARPVLDRAFRTAMRDLDRRLTR
ncbi:SRPBCC family protein [Streptomyces sp. NPDC088725]|uniref:SRPBCC family protein n=1 Tax=Streptomyces sp. NPDC088725 TaxID=3365873 RepID=UPI00382536D3